MPLSPASPVRSIVLAGLVAGLFAGLCAGALGLALGEGRIDAAISVESSLDAESAPSDGDQRQGAHVSRGTQHLGLVLATSLYGLAVGGLIALGFAFVRGRTAHRSDRHLALGLVAAVFIAVVAVPFLKYPANPPGVGDPETIGYRTGLYVTIVAGSLAALLAAWRIAKLVPARRRALRLAAAAATFASLAALLVLGLPQISEVPPAFPGGLLDEFRLTSLALQLTLWSVLALGFSTLVSRRR